MSRIAFLLFFIGIPLIEIALFIIVGEKIGLPATIAVVIITAILGTTLLRSQGFGVLNKFRSNLQDNQIPVEAIGEAILLFTAGILLLTPGFLTDTFGFLLFIPAFRRALGLKLLGAFLQNGNVHIFGNQQNKQSNQYENVQDRPRHPRSNHKGNGPIIEGDFEDLDPKEENISKRSRESSDRNGQFDKENPKNNSPWKHS